MRAVNLIPDDAGRGGRGAGGATGAYATIGVLALLLVGVVAYVLTNNALVEKRSQLASLETQSRTAQAQAAATKPYRDFAALADARVETVRQLGETRFDWHRAFDELARVMPEDVWLTSLLGTVTTGVSVDGAGSGDTATLRGALPNPAIELTGCTTGHEQVARLISRLRLMTGVARVSLVDSEKADPTGGSGTGASGSSSGAGSDCRYGHGQIPQFGIVVFFAPLPQASAPVDPAAAAAGTATPAASTTPAQSTPPPGAAANASSNGSDMR